MGARAGKYKFGARAGKYKLGARAGKYKLGARAGKCKLGARTGKYKLGARAGGQAKGRWPGNTNTRSFTKRYSQKVLLLKQPFTVFKNFAEFTKKHQYWSLFVIK